MVEQSAVNRLVVGSSPTAGAIKIERGFQFILIPLFLYEGDKMKKQDLSATNRETNIRFNKALTALKSFSIKWNENAKQILVWQLVKGIREAKFGDKKVAENYLREALSERFYNDKDDQFYWGLKGQQYLGEAIQDFVPVAVLCRPTHMRQIHQFCQEVYPAELAYWPKDTFTNPRKKELLAHLYSIFTQRHKEI